jgi:hypothetical protein
MQLTVRGNKNCWPSIIISTNRRIASCQARSAGIRVESLILYAHKKCRHPSAAAVSNRGSRTIGRLRSDSESLTLRVGGEYLSPCRRDRVNDDLDWDLAVAPAPQMRPHRSIFFDFVYELR